MARLSLTAAGSLITTDETGVASFSIQVPGTFNGVVDGSNGRHIQTVEFWSVNGTDGDFISNMRIEDSDGVIPVPARVVLPLYPVLIYFVDTDAQSPMISGLYLKPGEVMKIEPMNKALAQFVASQLYLKGDFNTANASPSGQKAICNVRWGVISSIG